MTTLMQRAADWLGDRLKQAAGRTVTIRRRGTIVGSVTGAVAFHEYELADETGVVTSSPVYDWTFTATDLAVVPRDGDRLIEVLSGVTTQYEVMPVGDSQSVMPLDDSGVLIRVHTKKVAG